MFRLSLIALNAVLIVAPAIAGPPAKTGKEVVIDEGARPSGVSRAYSGQCGRHRYFIKITPGRVHANAIEELSIDGKSVSLADEFLSPVGETPDLIDAVINRCEPDRALIRLDVANPAENYKLGSYFFWLTRDGAPSALFRR